MQLYSLLEPLSLKCGSAMRICTYEGELKLTFNHETAKFWSPQPLSSDIYWYQTVSACFRTTPGQLMETARGNCKDSRKGPAHVQSSRESTADSTRSTPARFFREQDWISAQTANLRRSQRADRRRRGLWHMTSRWSLWMEPRWVCFGVCRTLPLPSPAYSGRTIAVTV